MKPTKNYIIAILLAIFIFNSFSFTAKSQTQNSAWFASFNTIRTGKKTSIHAEAQLRSSNKAEHLQTAFVRGGLNFSIKKNMTASAGYGYFHNRKVTNNITTHPREHRIWQQYIVSHSVKKIKVNHRFRLEQRFIEKVKIVNAQPVTGDYDYANRFRYFIRNILPFTEDAVFNDGLFVALQNEVFLNFGNTSTVNGKSFDQNRFYLATGYRFSKKFDLEIGYMNQYISGINSNFTNNHILQVGSYLRL